MREELYVLTVLITGLAAVMAWVAKLRWSKEYSAAKEAQLSAKDETIRAKDQELSVRIAQIEGLESELRRLSDLSPKRQHERFLETKELLEARIDELEAEMHDTHRVKAELERMEQERRRLIDSLQSLESKQQAIDVDFERLREQNEELMRANEVLAEVATHAMETESRGSVASRRDAARRDTQK